MIKIRWFFNHILKFPIGILLSLFIRKDNCSWIIIPQLTQDYFGHNTKYLFLYSSTLKQKGIKVYWICKNNNTIIKCKKKGIKNVYKQNSLQGIYYSLKSKYWFYDWGVNTYLPLLSYKAHTINLWHGIPLKKIEYDIENYKYKYKNIFYKSIYEFLKIKHMNLIANNLFDKKCFASAFQIAPQNIIELGSPRLDVIRNEISNAELFMEEDFNNIKNFKAQGKRLFIYMPTFRDTGKDISGWLKSKKLQQILEDNNAILVCKLHSLDKNSLDFDLSKEFYKMDSDSDVYPILKYTDALITDYSSIYFDYLLLDKPILYYSPDLEEYQEKCRGFYEPYENLTAGTITQTEEELFSAMQNVIEEIDNHKEQRKALRDRMFKYQDGRNCERVVEWIKSLDEKKKK